MIETHPFGVFVPPMAKYLILGSFPPRQSTQGKVDPESSWAWYYGNPKNHFWKILEQVYGRSLNSNTQKKNLMEELGIGLGDVIWECERFENSNLDANLKNVVYNNELLERILSKNKIEKIFFSSKFVQREFKKHFREIWEKNPNLEMITLPSPSPRFAKMTLAEKIGQYKKLLPKISK